MSGTSLDGVDYALCEVELDRVQLVCHWHVQFPVALRGRLNAAARGEAPSDEVGQLHHDLGRFYARQAARNSPRPPRLVGLHGQTIYHRPHPLAPATLQIGEPAYLVETFRVPVVSNFRALDLAAGGQGAPLATLFHKVVFARRGKHICVNNLGGISNVTSIDWRQSRKPRMLAFDTGPANVLIDLAMRRFTKGRLAFDNGGRWAARGTVSEDALRRWLAHPYLRRPPPKSTGRELFGERFLQRALRDLRRQSRYNVLATLTEFSARALTLNYQLHLPSKPDAVILTGGGAANRTLLNGIARQFQKVNPEVLTSEELGWPRQCVEPAAFALLAYYRWARLPANLPATTGASRPALLGQLSEP